MKNKAIIWHLVALLTVAVWGSTFVFTKMLLQGGLSPAEIFTIRFIIAYVLMAAFCWWRGERRLMTATLKDELVMVALGITGGSLYFLTENAAMLYTTATNTSLIVCSCPLFTMLLARCIYYTRKEEGGTRNEERITPRKAFGSLLACAGMAVVVLNGHFVLQLSPMGDLLAFAACLCWAAYSILMKKALERYPTLLITRKVFGYGLLTILPYFIIPHLTSHSSFLLPPSSFLVHHPEILLNLLFLGVVASTICYLIWNWVISKLGAVTATNWVYFNPITTILFASWLLDERITVWFLLGTALTLVGMWLCEKKM